MARNSLIIVMALWLGACASYDTMTGAQAPVSCNAKDTSTDCAQVRKAVDKLFMPDASTEDLCVALFYSAPPKSEISKLRDQTEDGQYFWENTLDSDLKPNPYNLYYRSLLTVRRAEVMKIIRHRGIADPRKFTDDPGIGDSVCAMYAADGRPSDLHVTEIPGGFTVQYVYRTSVGVEYFYSDQSQKIIGDQY